MDDAHERTHVLLMPHDLIHREIIGSDDERIGFVRDLLIDEVDWKVRFLHVTQGGLLGLDERHFLVGVVVVPVARDAEAVRGLDVGQAAPLPYDDPIARTV